MPEIITKIDIALPEELNRLTEINFLRAISWKDESKEIKNRIVEPFEVGLFSSLPYNDSNIPKTEVRDRILPADNLEFIITTTPTTKVTSYSNVGTELENYLKFLLGQYENQVLREGIITIDNEPYLKISLLIDKINQDIENFKSGRAGIRQNVEIAKPDTKIDIPSAISIVIGRDYSTFSELNARAYLDAKKILVTGNERAKTLERLMLEETLKTIGTKKIKETYTIVFPFENISIVYQLIPRSSISYGSIVSAFIKEKPKIIKSNSQIGDLIKAQMYLSEEEKELLKSKSLVDEDFETNYRPRIRSEEVYIRLKGLITRFSLYKVKHSSSSIEKNYWIHSTTIS